MVVSIGPSGDRVVQPGCRRRRRRRLEGSGAADAVVVRLGDRLEAVILGDARRSMVFALVRYSTRRPTSRHSGSERRQQARHDCDVRLYSERLDRHR